MAYLQTILMLYADVVRMASPGYINPGLPARLITPATAVFLNDSYRAASQTKRAEPEGPDTRRLVIKNALTRAG